MGDEMTDDADAEKDSTTSGAASIAVGSVIEADSATPDDDSEELASTRSLTQSIFNYPTENGRRYHKYREGSYMYPNDEVECERQELFYELVKLAMGGRLFYAPLMKPKKILDIGTGIGSWPIEMAELFPDCEITGTDLSPIQPDWVPSNVRFVVDDASELDWLYPPDTFDFIHTRTMLGSFEEFRAIIKRAFTYIKPGGWMESQEYLTTPYCDDGTMPSDWTYLEWVRRLEETSLMMGRPLRVAHRLKRWYEEAGFVDVHEEVVKIPLNPWPKDPALKDLGRLMELNLLDGLQAFSLALLHRGLGWNQNEIEVYLVDVRRAVRDRSIHAYSKQFIVWGRKPESATTTTTTITTNKPTTNTTAAAATAATAAPAATTAATTATMTENGSTTKKANSSMII